VVRTHNQKLFKMFKGYDVKEEEEEEEEEDEDEKEYAITTETNKTTTIEYS